MKFGVLLTVLILLFVVAVAMETLSALDRGKNNLCFLLTAPLPACQHEKITSVESTPSIESVVCLFTDGGSVKLQVGVWADGLRGNIDGCGLTGQFFPSTKTHVVTTHSSMPCWRLQVIGLPIRFRHRPTVAESVSWKYTVT